MLYYGFHIWMTFLKEMEINVNSSNPSLSDGAFRQHISAAFPALDLADYRNELDDDEPLVRNPPLPSEVLSRKILLQPDPALHITPEKSVLQQKSNLKHFKNKNQKQKHRVHFSDIGSRCSSDDSCNDSMLGNFAESLDSSKVPLSAADFTTARLRSPVIICNDENQTECDAQSKNGSFIEVRMQELESEDFNSTLPQVQIVREEKPSHGTDVAFSEMEPQNFSQWEGHRKNAYTIISQDKSKSVQEDELDSGIDTCTFLPSSLEDCTSKDKPDFAKPELNSTLQIVNKLKDLKEIKLDVPLELKKRILGSAIKHEEINEKAASKVCIKAKNELYSDLISLDLPIHDLCAQAALEISSKVKSKQGKHSRGRQIMTTSKEPELCEFFTPDLQKESVDFSLLGLSKPGENLCSAPTLAAFDLYRRNRAWEGLHGLV